MLPSDMYSQPNAADPVLDERAVLDMVRRHVVHCSAVTRIDETGGEARAYVLDDNLVLKVQRPHRLRPRTSLEKEAFFLPTLSRCTKRKNPLSSAECSDNAQRFRGGGR